MRNHLLTVLLISLLALGLGACSSKRVSRVDAGTATDLSGKWNDTDSRLVADEMIADVLGRPWFADFSAAEKRKPRVIIGVVLNKSHEHIPIQTFTNDLERALINAGKVTFVASSTERTQLRDERSDQLNQAGAAGKKAQAETAADYMLQGSINTILDELEGTKVVFYQVDLTLIDINSNEKVWIGQKKIKKVIDRDSVGW